MEEINRECVVVSGKELLEDIEERMKESTKRTIILQSFMRGLFPAPPNR